MVLLLGVSFVFAFGGFLVMLISALAIERNARRLGKVGVQQVAQSSRVAGLRDAMGSTRSRLKDRMQREEED